MYYFFLVFLCFASHAESNSYFEVVSDEWEEWKALYDKKYDTKTEEKFRLKVFAENKLMVAKHNALAHKGKTSSFVKIDHLGDQLSSEIAKTRCGFKQRANSHYENNEFKISENATNVDLPKEVDWRIKGGVTPVKNQEKCGSCWAFSATGALEGQTFRKTGKLVSLSEQNLVDCVHTWTTDGCRGGNFLDAFWYVHHNHGIDTEKSYPYHGKDEKCHFNPEYIGAKDQGYVMIKEGDEEAIKAAVATKGPVSVGICALTFSFQRYSHGILDDETCCDFTGGLNHAVLIVGYGTDENGKDYWLVKNEWGTSWGEKGYIKMARNKDMCGISRAAAYPLV